MSDPSQKPQEGVPRPVGAADDVQPIGMAAAAAEIAGGAPSSDARVPEVLPPAVDATKICRPLARMTCKMLTNWGAAKHPAWKANDDELDVLADAWGAYLAEILKSPTPLTQALLVTGVFAMPRMGTIVVEKGKAKREARERGPRRPGQAREREELLDEEARREADGDGTDLGSDG